jgi:hypothetical protein
MDTGGKRDVDNSKSDSKFSVLQCVYDSNRLWSVQLMYCVRQTFFDVVRFASSCTRRKDRRDYVI